MASHHNEPVSKAEAAALFDDLAALPAVVLAVSGGPDSTALMWLAARWRAARETGPELIAVTVDHALRKESAAEARTVAELARRLGIAHRTLRWRGAKPKTGLPQAARNARYRLLAEAARKAGAAAILTAHTRDDQAETVLIRMSRGSGLTGLAGMARVSPVPAGRAAVRLIRPFLGIPKSRLIATLAAAHMPFADDPTNRDPRFTRARLRGLMPRLAEEGLDAARLALLGERLARAEAALAAQATTAYNELVTGPAGTGQIGFERAGFVALSPEIALRLIGRAIDQVGDEGPVELGKLEALAAALAEACRGPKARFRRSLAGAVVTLGVAAVTVERAPPRRSRALTKRGGGARRKPKRR
jgi:tRNA(Ile)-lysidine synthase